MNTASDILERLQELNTIEAIAQDMKRTGEKKLSKAEREKLATFVLLIVPEVRRKLQQQAGEELVQLFRHAILRTRHYGFSSFLPFLNRANRETKHEWDNLKLKQPMTAKQAKSEASTEEMRSLRRSAEPRCLNGTAHPLT